MVSAARGCWESRGLPSTGAIIAGTGASLVGVGSVAWTNPGNITASDDTRATAATAGSTTNWLVATNFNFASIPNSAVIVGITGTAEASYTGGTGVTITAASFVVGDAVVGTQLVQAQAVTTSDANYTVDLSPGTVGYPITPALLKVSTTGFAISTTGVGVTNSRVDAMYLTVTYMVAGRKFRTMRVRRTNRH